MPEHHPPSSKPQKGLHIKIGAYELFIPPAAFRWVLILLTLLLASVVVLVFILCTTPSGRSFLLQLVQAMRPTTSVPI